jgi:hypothetical protein
MIQYLTTSFFTIETFITIYVWFCVGFTTTLILGWFFYGLYKVCKLTDNYPLNLIKPHAKMRIENHKKKENNSQH